MDPIKHQLKYQVKNYQDVYNYMLNITSMKLINVKRGKNAISYYIIPMAFDIETTNIYYQDDHYGFMYHWQVAYGDMVILGREWWEFEELIKRIIAINKLSRHRRIICWVANLGFEFQFIRKRFSITELFAKERREPLKFLLNDSIEFRDALALTGGGLYQLAKDYTFTQKLIGDLDYTIPRSTRTPLSIDEINYCINDVVILAEFALYLFDTYLIPAHKIPLTRTGILRNKIKQTLIDRGIYKQVTSAIGLSMPNEQEYRNMMAYLFRGGYVHANIRYTKQSLRNIYSYDETSAYPAVMLQECRYPTKFFKYHGSIEDIDLNTNTFIAVFTFYSFKAVTNHSIESVSKAISISGNRIIDNGRIRYADQLEVFLTDIDFSIYQKFYTWESFEVSHIFISKVTKLPKYILDNMLTDYDIKQSLKNKGLSGTIEYVLCKNQVNSYYGMMVTRLHECNYIYIDGEWKLSDKKSYDDMIRGLFLLPQWGIYVTAFARLRLLNMVYNMHNHVVYNDTDSIKLNSNSPRIKRIITAYNQKLILWNKLNYPDLPSIWALGTFDYEGKYRKFKTLGAKRYIYYDHEKILHAVISGLPHADQVFAADSDPFVKFDDEMYVSHSNRLISNYHDDPSTFYINGVKMHEESSVSLYESNFNLSINEVYNEFINYIINTIERRTIG